MLKLESESMRFPKKNKVMELVLNPTGYDDTRIIYFIVDRIS